MATVSKKSLAVQLSQLVSLSKINRQTEQYQTDGDTAATMLCIAYMNGHINNKHIVDLGCGNGILGIGALLLGAQHVTFVDLDKNALEILKKNVISCSLKEQSTIIKSIVSEANIPFSDENIVIMNPPFGTKKVHADRAFLTKAITLAPHIYSLHLHDSQDFIESFGADHDFIIEHIWELNFPIPKSHMQHKKKVLQVPTIYVHLSKAF
jgi:putative methylase